MKHARHGFLDPLCEIPGVVIDLQGLQIFSRGSLLCPTLKLKKVWPLAKDSVFFLIHKFRSTVDQQNGLLWLHSK